MDLEGIMIAILIILIMFLCFYVVRWEEQICVEKLYLEELVEYKNNKINELDESNDKLFEELEYVKAEVGFDISNYIEEE